MSLPVQYARVGVLGGLIGVFLSVQLGVSEDPATSRVAGILGAGAGGFLGGLSREGRT
jgi:hypothetical protein